MKREVRRLACRMLRGLGRAHLRGGRQSQGTPSRGNLGLPSRQSQGLRAITLAAILFTACGLLPLGVGDSAEPASPADSGARAGSSPQSRGSSGSEITALGKNPQGRPEYRHEPTGIVFVELPGGSFLMGSPPGEEGGQAPERPQHRVTVSGFLMAKHEVTQAQWKRVMGKDPSFVKGDGLPVDNVSWDECKEFVRRTGLRLPTEAEWEYACRAGSEGPYAAKTLDEIGWNWQNSGKTTHPPGKLKPNAFGLHDMSGNVAEWCEDFHDPDFYASAEAAKEDPVCTRANSGKRVLRGGHCRDFYVWRLRSAARASHSPGSGGTLSFLIGLRPVLATTVAAAAGSTGSAAPTEPTAPTVNTEKTAKTGARPETKSGPRVSIPASGEFSRSTRDAMLNSARAKFSAALQLQLVEPEPAADPRVPFPEAVPFRLLGSLSALPPEERAKSGSLTERLADDDGFRVQVRLRNERDAPALLARIQAAGGRLDSADERTLALRCDAGSQDLLASLALAEEVESVTEVPRLATGEIYATRNLDALDTHQVEQLTAAYRLSGAGVAVGLWDGGAVRTSHVELATSNEDPTSRAVQEDDPPAGLSQHATHVAGTIGARGDYRKAKGMAPSAALRCYDWNDNLREVDAVADLLACSNHSYGEVRGWSSVHLRHLGETYLFWWWHGDEAVDAEEDYLYGKYDGQSQAFDELAYGHPGHSIFVAAGNDRGEGPPEGTWHRAKRKGQWIWSDAPRLENGGREGGYDTLAGSAVSKNTITVGAIEDMTEEFLRPEDIRVTEFSSWGPADDGRVKPDLVANGSRVFSISAAADRGRDAYAQLSGTSMAAPVATGIGALLSELYQRVQKRPIRSDELKACLIHTAMSPEPGPSYRIGWGSIRADRAGDLVAEKIGRLVRGECGASAATWTGRSQPGAPIRLTLVWLDPPGRPNTGGLDDEHSALVNDLELTVTDPAGLVFFPWSLDPRHPAAPASNSGPNHRDNVERVDVAGEAVIAGEWRIRVTGPGATQAFALAVSGLDRLTRGE